MEEGQKSLTRRVPANQLIFVLYKTIDFFLIYIFRFWIRNEILHAVHSHPFLYYGDEHGPRLDLLLIIAEGLDVDREARCNHNHNWWRLHFWARVILLPVAKTINADIDQPFWAYVLFFMGSLRLVCIFKRIYQSNTKQARASYGHRRSCEIIQIKI